MQMINVMKRLAELDAMNPNVKPAKALVKENTDLAECGPMGVMDSMGGMGRLQTPASINNSAGSGPELSSMLKDIMSLAGIHKVEPSHLGVEPEPMALTAEPAMSGGSTPSDQMRSVIDKLNPEMDDEEDSEEDGEEETDESADEFGIQGVNSTPSNPNKPPAFNANKFAHQENQPGQGDRMDGDRPKAYADMNKATADLFAEYKKFVAEGSENSSIGQQMARDGITYSPEKEDELIGLMSQYMEKAGMSSKAIRYYLSYDEDFISDQLSELPKQGVAEGLEDRKTAPGWHSGFGLSEGKPSAGMTKGEKSAVVKKAKAGKDIGKPGKGFEKVEKAAATGGAKDPKAVAAAAMWKQQAKK